MKKIQPEVIVVGSDAFDLHLLTSFRRDPDVRVDTEIDGDALASVEYHWNKFIHELHEAAPQAKFVFIWGNHERRIVNKVLDDSPEWRKMIWRHFKTIIQCGGRVWWIGETDRVRIGPLLVQHGNRHGVNAAKGHLNDLAYQVSTMFGHTHKLGIHSREGEDFYVESVNAGCLCELRPHYVRGTKLRQRWIHGTAIALVDLQSRDVWFTNLRFKHDYSHDRDTVYTYLINERVEYVHEYED